MIAVWFTVALLLAVMAPKPDPDVGETADLLPSDTPVHSALSALADHFGDKSGLSSLAIVFERAGGPITAADLQSIQALTQRIMSEAVSQPLHAELATATLRTPSTLAIAGGANPMISADHRAALVTISLPFNFISKSAGRIAKHVQGVVAHCALPEGLTATVTGSAGFGYDYAIATERSHSKTLIVTLISVVVILLLVYRAPIAAGAPLLAVSVAAAAVFKALAIAERFGLHGGTAEQIFTFVLLYGAGIDYSLLFVSRYRERLDEGIGPTEAIIQGLNGSVAAIFSSALMTVCGLGMLCFARFSVFRFSGPTVVFALIVAALVAATLVPAVLAVIGPRTFSWNGMGPYQPRRRDAWTFWPWLADRVITRPKVFLVITLIALILPAIRGGHINWDYNSLASLKQTYNAPRGSAVVARHWPAGEIAPVTVLITSDRSITPVKWESLDSSLVKQFSGIRHVQNVRSLSQPLGAGINAGQLRVVRFLAGDRIAGEYLSADRRALRLSVILDITPLTSDALHILGEINAAAKSALEADKVRAAVQLAGATAEMADLRDITQDDFYRTAAMALAAILVVVSVVLRDLLLSVFIVGITVLSYFAALGITYWFFHGLGVTGLEWKVQMLLFIVLVAVGQDYSIFFAARFAQEARSQPTLPATRAAMITTGPVISSCGLIMAATLGSVMAADITMLVQLGFAFVVGMLMDTFVVRPLLLPAFIVITRRTLSKATLLRNH